METMYFLFHFAIIHFTVGNLSALDDVLATPLTLYRKQASSLPPSGSRTFLDTNEKKKKKQTTLKQLRQNGDQDEARDKGTKKRNCAWS